MLVAIKLLHTSIWAVLAGFILALPVLGIVRRFRWAAILSAIVWIECLVILLSGGRCPLTYWAAQFTTDRSPNFDIYLPAALAQHNKAIFGWLFIVGEFVVAGAWLWQKGRQNQRQRSRVETSTLPRVEADATRP
jgi:hypothetical protein